LALDAIDQFGLIAPADLQNRMTVGEQTADPLDSDLAAMVLLSITVTPPGPTAR